MRPNYFDLTVYRWRGTYLPKGECSACRMVVALLNDAASLARLWSRRRNERRMLAAFDWRTLRDIGVTPSEMAREINKPFWRP
jgi:uncharacterized protein YjiS (DUF1127 family)